MNSRLAKTITSVFIAPVAASICTMPLFFMIGFAIGVRGLYIIVLAFTIFIGIPATLIIGVPVHALLLAKGLTRWWSYAIAGSLCGIPIAVVHYQIWMWVASGINCSDAARNLALADPKYMGHMFPCWGSIVNLVYNATMSETIILAGAITAYISWRIRRPDLDRVGILPEQLAADGRLAKTTEAVLIAPVAAGILMTPIVYTGAALPELSEGVLFIVLFIAIFIGIPATLITGTPVHAFLLRKGWTRWWSYAIAGSLCGIAFAVVEHQIWTWSSSVVDCTYSDCAGLTARATIAGSTIVSGAITASFYWLIRRPDLDRARTRLQLEGR